MKSETEAPERDSEKTTRRAILVFGVVLLVVGIFLLVALNNQLEIIVWISGPVLAVGGIVLIVVMMVKNRPWVSTLAGLLATILGSLLGIHDLLFPPGFAFIVHAGIGIVTLAAGLIQLFAKKRLLSRLFPGPARSRT